MTKPEFTFYKGYVDNESWNTDFVNKVGYVPISKNLIKTTKDIVYEKGVRVTIINTKNRQIQPPKDYLLQGNLIRINPLWGAEIELHSETKKGLEKLIKDLGLPDNKEDVSQE